MYYSNHPAEHKKAAFRYMINGMKQLPVTPAVKQKNMAK
jgi:hypothetical protein